MPTPSAVVRIVLIASTVILAVGATSLAASPDNGWTPEMEKEFQSRKAWVIEAYAAQNAANNHRYGTTFFESEKSAYPAAMFDLLAGHKESALAMLQEEDNLAEDNAHTLGIDLYPCFTLKGQVRKYFYFGDQLDRAYRDRMTRAAKIWTEKDPHHRPHPTFGDGDGKPGWRPQNRGGWVDVRSTDNLKAMRETSVYLFAETTGNRETAAIYKERIADHVAALHHIGMSEWDSENYLGHGVAPFLSLYDFAEDREVKALARAALDWFAAAAAVKYYHGGWGGPTKRDYGGANVVFGANASITFWPWFGDAKVKPPRLEPDLIHVVTSTYRPPAAVVALARKEFERPVTLQDTKPAYGVFAPDAVEAPMYWETMHYGRTFALGSVLAADPQGDVAPMKLTVDNSRRGVDFLVLNTVAPGEKVEQCPPGKRAGDQITQHKHMLVWLRKDDRPGTQWALQIPKTAKVERDGNATLIRFEKPYAALIPIGGVGGFRSSEISGGRAELYTDETLLLAESTDDGHAGFAMIVGEDSSYGSFDKFKQAMRNIGIVDDRLEQGIVEVRDPATSTWMRHFQNGASDRCGLVRNGESVDWGDHFDIYQPLHGAEGPISLGWGEGALRIEAGGHAYTSTVTADGKVNP